MLELPSKVDNLVLKATENVIECFLQEVEKTISQLPDDNLIKEQVLQQIVYSLLEHILGEYYVLRNPEDIKESLTSLFECIKEGVLDYREAFHDIKKEAYKKYIEETT